MFFSVDHPIIESPGALLLLVVPIRAPPLNLGVSSDQSFCGFMRIKHMYIVYMYMYMYIYIYVFKYKCINTLHIRASS